MSSCSQPSSAKSSEVHTDRLNFGDTRSTLDKSLGRPWCSTQGPKSRIVNQEMARVKWVKKSRDAESVMFAILLQVEFKTQAAVDPRRQGPICEPWLSLHQKTRDFSWYFGGHKVVLYRTGSVFVSMGLKLAMSPCPLTKMQSSLWMCFQHLSTRANSEQTCNMILVHGL